MFSVQSVGFAFVCNNSFDDFEVIPYDEPITYTRSGEAFKNYSNGERKYINAIIRTLYRILTPSKPFKGLMKSRKSPLNFEVIIHVLSETDVKELKIIWE